MNSYRARRATTDDLPQLIDLWKAEQLPAEELEKAFTEFQIVEDGQGKVLAAIGLHIEKGDGKLYDETFLDFALTDTLRPIIWERLQLILPNFGLFRVWMQDAAPFWRKSASFSEASREILAKLPANFGTPNPGWLVLQLKSESASLESVDKTFAMFQEAERARTEALKQRAKTVKVISTIFAALLLLLALIGLAYFLHRGPMR